MAARVPFARKTMVVKLAFGGRLCAEDPSPSTAGSSKVAKRNVVRVFSLLAFWLSVVTSPTACLSHTGSIAVTFDDLPIFGLYAPPSEAESITSALLDGFRKNHWPVTGFVNEIQLEGTDRDERIGLLRRWLDAGMDLGNHSYSHRSLTRTPIDAFIADVARGDEVTRPLMREHGKQERWFRHPYLETGPSLVIRKRFERWLRHRGYRVAPVTMENSDWEFAEPYDAALARKDAGAAAAIRAAYLSYTALVVPWYRQAAQDLLGREPAFVLLLHASRLNAGSIDALAAILRANRLKPVGLDRALADRAYRIRDNYAGADGDEWITRWSLTLHRQLSGDALPNVPGWIAKLDEEAEAADPDQQAPGVP